MLALRHPHFPRMVFTENAHHSFRFLCESTNLPPTSAPSGTRSCHPFNNPSPLQTPHQTRTEWRHLAPCMKLTLNHTLYSRPTARQAIIEPSGLPAESV